MCVCVCVCADIHSQLFGSLNPPRCSAASVSWFLDCVFTALSDPVTSDLCRVFRVFSPPVHLFYFIYFFGPLLSKQRHWIWPSPIERHGGKQDLYRPWALKQPHELNQRAKNGREVSDKQVLCSHWCFTPLRSKNKSINLYELDFLKSFPTEEMSALI